MRNLIAWTGRMLASAWLVTSASMAAAADFTDIWYTPSEAGWGVNLVQSQDFIFATFFIYGSNGAPTWYTAELNWDGASKYRGAVYATTGTAFSEPWQPGASTVATAGTASFEPSSTDAYRGTLTYAIDGFPAVTKAIERQTLTRIALGGTYTGGQSGTYSGCTSSASNATYIDRYDLDVSHTAVGSATFQFRYTSGLTCTLAGTVVQNGQLYRIPEATYKCSDGLATTALMHEIKATAQGIEGRISAPSIGGGCREEARFSAVY